MKVEIVGNKVIKTYDSDEHKSCMLKDIKKMNQDGYFEVEGEPVNEYIVVNKGYKITYEKRG